MTQSQGLSEAGCALAVTASDFDEDGDLDLIVANDFGPDIEPNRFYRNNTHTPNGAGFGFTEVGTEINADQAIYGMGIAIGDYDQDLDLDYYITNNGSNILLNNDGAIFSEIAMESKADNTWNVQDSIFAVGWGCAFLDIDNDTDLDLYITNGFVPGPDFLPTNISDRDRILVNNGDGTFKDDDPDYQIDNAFVARGMAYSDLDNDGDLDIISVVQKAPINATRNTKMFLNQLPTDDNQHNWLQIKLTGTTVNRDAYGSKVYVYAGGQTFLQESNGGASHCSNSTSILHFGLGNIESVDSLKVIWTGGWKAQTHTDIQVNRRIIVTEDELAFTTNTQDLPFGAALKLYPNPNRQEMFLEIPSSIQTQSLEYAIFSMAGQAILPFQKLDVHSASIKIDTQALPSGIYFLRLKNETAQETFKFVKH